MVQVEQLRIMTTQQHVVVTYVVGGDTWPIDIRGFGMDFTEEPTLDFGVPEIVAMLPPAYGASIFDWWRYEVIAPKLTDPPIRLVLYPHPAAEPVGRRIEWIWETGSRVIKYREYSEMHRDDSPSEAEPTMEWQIATLRRELRITEVHRYPLGGGPHWIQWDMGESQIIRGWTMLPDEAGL